MAIPSFPVVIRGDRYPGGGRGVSAVHGAVEHNEPGDFGGGDQDDATMCQAGRGDRPSLTKFTAVDDDGAIAAVSHRGKGLDKGHCSAAVSEMPAEARMVAILAGSDDKTWG
jgi:hypothetical protein